MTNLWLDSKNHDRPYYIGRNIASIDSRLTAISPPSEIHRAPRSLNERKYWKASEWRAFLFHALVILQGILPTRYLNHFFLLVYGVHNLLSDTITLDMRSRAEACLAKFSIQMEQLYGLKHCTFNVHSLTHLAECVKNTGPLWATSAFLFESYNHVLLSMFNGTQYIPGQIVETFLLENKAASLARKCLGEDAHPAVRETVSKICT